MDAIETVPTPSNEFKIFSGLLKAQTTEDGRMRFRATASSTTRDMHGDTMEHSALEDMLAAANNNLTIFLNHSYNVPEDVAGSVTAASLQPRGMDGEGNPNWDLDFVVDVNDANQRAVDAFKAIEKGTKLGLSIGAMIPENGAVIDKKTGAYRIKHVDLLETSIVGIPANPRSWVQNAVKALKTKTESVPAVLVSLTPEELKEAPAAEPDICGERDEDATLACDFDPDHDGRHSWQPDEAAPEETKDGSDAVSGGSQEAASESEPETEPASADVVTDAASAETMLVAAVPELTARLEDAVGEIVDLRKRLGEAEQARDDATRERDEALKTTLEVLSKASDVIDKVASIPLGRKAVARAAIEDYSALERIYGPSLLKLIRKDNSE